MVKDLLKEQDFYTSKPQRYRKEQLTASVMLVPPVPLGHGRCYQRGRTPTQAGN